MRDPYDILGVSKSADDAAVRAAYRKLAKKYHPDLNPGDAAAEKRFKEASNAFDILGDKEKRAQFDRGEIGPDGSPRAPFGFGGGGAANGGGYGPRGERVVFSEGFDQFGDLFGDLFGGGFGGRRRERRESAPQDLTARASVSIDLVTALKGGKTRVTGPGGETVEVTVPAGAHDGKTLRLRGKGPAGRGGMRGDLLLTLKVKPHPDFRADGHDVRGDLPVSLKEAVMGAKVTAPTIDGPVQVSVPKGSNGGAVLRLKGKGAVKPDGSRGDHYAALKIMLPEGPDPELERFLNDWSKAGVTPKGRGRH